MISKFRQWMDSRYYRKRENLMHSDDSSVAYRFIILRDDERKKILEKVFPTLIEYHVVNCYSANEARYIDFKTNEIWRVVSPEDLHESRIYRAIVDSTVDRKTYKDIIKPLLEPQCYSLKFF